MAKGDVSRDRTRAAIIDSAAAVFAERAEATSMEEIASAAGVARATLYRSFSNREQLVGAMAEASVRELAARIEQAHLEAIPFEEGLARVARAIIATGSKYAALNGDTAKHSEAYPAFDSRVLEPIRALFRRAIADGSVREDLPSDVLIDLFSGLIKAALDATTSGRQGIEGAAATVTTFFLHGASTPSR
jgi:TetR/AcrR family transcriptional regulator, mexCD-oprJ operon repressor